MESGSLEKAWEAAANLLTEYGLQVLGAIAVLILGKIASSIIGRLTRKAMNRSKAEPALIGFVVSLVKAAVMVFAVIAALDLFGVQTTSFVAVLGAAGLAIGLALQGSLANFAAGVLLLVFKPFKIGDFVNAGGSAGSVLEIGIFTTTLKTPDNQKIIIPNAAVTGGTIVNVNHFDTRRVDLTAGIAYGDDIGKAKGILEKLLADHPKVLQDPAPTVEVSELADSSVNFVVRPWVSTPDYWPTYFELTRAIKDTFDREGISIPFPQQDVYMHQTGA